MDEAALSLGLTPPPGRLGHSLPTPRLLGKGPIFVSHYRVSKNSYKELSTCDEQYQHEKTPPPLIVPEMNSNINNNVAGALWYTHRDPLLSPLDQIRPLPHIKLEPFAESWMEDEDEREELSVLTNRLTLTPEPHNLERFTGDSLLSFSYNPSTASIVHPPSQDLGGSFVSAFSHPLNSSLNLPFLTSPAKDKDTFLFPTTARNPNKSLITINATTSVILVVNKVACDMFGYGHNELVGMKIQQLFTEPYQARQRALVEQNIDIAGETVLVSGKVMDAVTSSGLEFPVSVWMKKVSSDQEPRVIVVIEPVERCSAHFTLNEEGLIQDCDHWLANLFGFDDVSEMSDKPLSYLIPSLVLPSLLVSDEKEDLHKQSLTGRTKDGTVFPLTLQFIGTSCESVNNSLAEWVEPNTTEEMNKSDTEDIETPPTDPTSQCVYTIHGRVTVYAALSGMISFLPNGVIHGCNHHFSLMLLGYSQQELLGKTITHLIPDFYNHIQYMEYSNTPFPPLSEEEGSDCEDKDEKEEESVVTLFPSVSERSISIDYALDVQLASIEEDPDENNEVFVSTQPDSTSEQEVVIEILPGMVTIGDTVYSYSDDESPPSYLSLPPTHTDHLNECDNDNTHKLLTDSHNTSETHVPLYLDTSSDDDNRHENPTQKENSSSTLSSNPPALINDPHHSPLNMTTDSPLLPSLDNKEHLFPLGHEMPSSSSTPAPLLSHPTSRLSSHESTLLPEGIFTGYAQHKDGSLLSIVFQLKQITIKEGHPLFCIWLSRDLDCERARIADLNRITPDPFINSFQVSPDVVPLSEQSEELLAIEGEYHKNYETLGPIGRGAFGFVKLASRREDEMMVVVKFIKKATVIAEHWMEHNIMGLVPREICLLAEVSHENIVQLLEAYENSHYFQLVMEKHGDGMDLFTFIESGPYLDEPLISFMFRQVLSALAYLHDRHILHRDVKDENIILNHQFNLKLIDFGSAAWMEEGTLFNTFCGTLEYCSPEVLLGNSYAGPELEMWSLGVTLYTLVYGENPFFDVEEIITGRLQPPFLVSPGLMKIILWLLHPDPKSRATLTDLQNDSWVNQTVDISQYSFNTVLKGALPDILKEELDASPELKLPDSLHNQYLFSRTLT